MKKRMTKKLNLKRETVLALTDDVARQIAAGGHGCERITGPVSQCSDSCSCSCGVTYIGC